MSPIKTNTIRVETWTETTQGVFKAPGSKKTQVLAEGDELDPGSYVFVRGTLRKNVNHIKREDYLVGVLVDFNTGEIIHELGFRGIWRRYKER